MLSERQGNSGYMVLQDHGSRWPVAVRSFRGAARFVDDDKYGRRVIGRDTAGDILCATLWEPDSRPMAGWAMAWPTLCLGTEGDQGMGSSGEDGDPNVGAAGGVGAAGAGGVAGGKGSGGKGASNVRPGTSVDPFAGRGGTATSGGTLRGGSAAQRGSTQVDHGWSIFTNGRLTGFTGGSGNADKIVQAKIDAQKKARAAWKAKQAGKGGGAGGGAGGSGALGPGGAVPPGARRQITGGKGSEQGPRTVGTLPIRDEGHLADKRFSATGSMIPDYWPSFPEGWVGVQIGGTEEKSQQQVWLPTDPRLLAVNKSPTGICGTLIFDLEPKGKVAIGGAGEEPGVAGRGARLQTFCRVVRTPATIQHLDIQEKPCGNVVAWQGAKTGQEGWPGLGAYYTIAPATTSASETPGGGSRQVTPGAGGQGAAGDRSGNGSGTSGNGTRGVTNSPTTVTTSMPGGAVLAFMDRAAMGPLHGGYVGDKHHIDKTLDQEEINPGHLDINAYWPMDLDRDGPLNFSTKPYAGGKWPLTANVHLSWNPRGQHKFFGKVMPGIWDWWAEVPFFWSGPPKDGPPDEPRDPPPPSDGPPTEVVSPPQPEARVGSDDPPGSAQTTPSGDTWGGRGQPGRSPTSGGGKEKEGRVDDKTASSKAPVRKRDRGAGGATADGHVASFAMWSLGGLLGRPQHTAPGNTDFRLSRLPSSASIYAEDRTRPVVARIEPWGAQVGGAWQYQNAPGVSRHRGGDAAGGFAIFAPQVDLADESTSYAPSGVTKSPTYFAFTPGTYTGWGSPTTSGTAAGDLADGAYRAGWASSVLTVQRRASGAWGDVLTFKSNGNLAASGYVSDTIRAGRIARWDFENGITGTPLTATVAGTGTATAAVPMSTARIGTVSLATGAGAGAGNGVGAMTGLAMMTFGTGEHTLEADVQVPTLPTGAQDFHVRIGFQDVATGVAANGATFEVQGSAIANWQCVTTNGAAATTTDSGIAVGTGIVKLKITVNADGSSVSFYINGTLVQTHTANIPTANNFGFGATIDKTVGAGSRGVSLDFIQHDFARTAAL